MNVTYLAALDVRAVLGNLHLMRRRYDGGGTRMHAGVRFLHVLCNQVAPMREFYSERLGLEEISHRDDDEWGWVAYESDGLQLMFHRWAGDAPVPVAAAWAWQPGDAQGTAPVMSFAIGIDPEQYESVAGLIRVAKDSCLTPSPTWRQDSYWGWTVKDPMGNTVEVFTMVRERPPGDPPLWTW